MGGCGRLYSGGCPQPCASISAVWPQRSLRYGSACTCDDWRCTQVFDSASSKNSRARKLTRLDSNSKSLEAAHSMQCILAKKMNLPKLHKINTTSFFDICCPLSGDFDSESACSHLDQSYRCIHVAWSQQWSGRSGRSGEYFLPLWSQSQYSFSREKLGSCYPGHERNIWICQTLAESNNAWVKREVPGGLLHTPTSVLCACRSRSLWITWLSWLSWHHVWL